MLKAAWSSDSDDSTIEGSTDEEADISVPLNFKRYTIQDRHVVSQRPNRKNP